MEAVPLVTDRDALSRVLVPNLNAAPGGRAFWDRARFFTVRPAGDPGPGEVLAGLSPLTALYPAATPPRRALAGVFWYAAATGTWYDPTSDELAPERGTFALAPATRALVRGALKKWLVQTLAGFHEGSLAALVPDRRAEGLLKRELEVWRDALAADPAAGDGVAIVDAPVPAPADEPAGVAPAFLGRVVRGAGAALLSDLPVLAGRLVVTRAQLTDRTRRVWGRLFGHHDLAGRVDALPVSGANLGEALGLGAHAAPVPFVVVDRLFTPRLAFVTAKGLSEGWSALEVHNGGQKEYALLPFEPQILEIVPPAALRAGVRAELSQDAEHYIVRLKVGEAEVTQLYATSGEGPHAVDDRVAADTLDLRLFPDFDLDHPAVAALLPAEDRAYYARARLAPDWDFDVRAFRVEPPGRDGAAGGAAGPGRVAWTGAAEKRGSVTATNPESPPNAYPPGEALFFTLPEKPAGFHFGGRGFCLLELGLPFQQGPHADEWEVGVDFGTSNTCVAVRTSGGAEVLSFPVMTTTLLRTPVYTALEPVNEGASAAYDFFYKLSADERRIDEGPYFPTQVLTQQAQLPAEAGAAFDLAAGLVHFRNVSLSGVSLLRLIQDFDTPAEGRPQTRRFRLEQDIKWSRREWLRTFMTHLRKQVTLTAARRNARVVRARFSYPKAFSLPEEVAFERALRSTWGALVVTPLASESEAVRRSLVGEDTNQHIVFDVGGGTTDVIGFDRSRAAFQTSFRLAAGQINEYVARAPLFREAVTKVALQEVPGRLILAGTQGGSARPMQTLNEWIGLLQTLENEDPSGRVFSAAFMRLAEHATGTDETARAVRGFFLSTALLFGGLAFFAWRLLGAAARGAVGDPRGFALSQVALTLTGNGSKLYRMVSPPQATFDGVFEGLFRRGLGLAPGQALTTKFGGIYRLPDGTLAPKVTVALGLLAGSDEAAPPVPVANVAGEAGAFGLDAADAPLVPFYARLRRDDGAPELPSEAPAELAAFLDALGEALPRGSNGRHPVVPGAGSGWTDGLKRDTYARARGVLKDRLLRAARALPEDAADAGPADVPALEPVFVAELIALLEQVREDYAA
jgi:hypothetical protein